MIEVSGLRKVYGQTVAVDSVSFVAADGLVTGLLGPNGAGKTTALRAITGIVRPDAGRAFVDGVDVEKHASTARARLGVLPEVVGLYDHLTVREHLVYGGELHGLGGSRLRARVQMLLDELGLTTLSERRAGTLSLGQRRRVALARAVVHDPPNVIFDEPTNGLDVLSARHVRQEIRRLAQSGRAVIVSSHVMPEVSAICDRIVILSRGRVVADDGPSAILVNTKRPSLEEAFVALIGSEEGLN